MKLKTEKNQRIEVTTSTGAVFVITDKGVLEVRLKRFQDEEEGKDGKKESVA